MADAQHLVADHRPQLQFDLGGEGKRPLRAHQQMRHVVGGVARHQRIEIVAADAALHFRKFLGDFGRFPFAESQHVGKQIEAVVARIQPGEIARHLTEMKHRAVGKGCVHRQRVIAHGAVAQRAAAAGIVAGHAADGGARRGGDIDRKPQAMFSELPVEVIQHDSRLDHAASIFDVERDDAVQVLGEIDDDAVIDGLAALRRAAAARRDDPAVVPGDAERSQGFVDGARHHHARRHDLVERRVGGIAAAVEPVEENLAGNLARQAIFKPHRTPVGHPLPLATTGNSTAQDWAKLTNAIHIA